jgi:hypothetical protein
MKNNLAAIAVISTTFISMTCAFGPNLAAQSRPPLRKQVVIAPAGRTDLNSALIDLDRVSQATQTDVAKLHVEKWKSGWKTGFLKDGSHRDQAQQAAGSLQRNLANALPGLIHDVQNSRGSVSATFKLYDDVSLVCEAVDSLISASETAGRKSEAAALTDDFSALTRVRRALSAYIQQASSAWETKGKAPYAAVSAPGMQSSPREMTSSSTPRVITDSQGVKKIIVDDTVPEKKPATAVKRKPTTVSNLE